MHIPSHLLFLTEKVNTVLGTMLLASVTYMACEAIIDTAMKAEQEQIKLTSEQYYAELYPLDPQF